MSFDPPSRARREPRPDKDRSQASRSQAGRPDVDRSQASRSQARRARVGGSAGPARAYRARQAQHPDRSSHAEDREQALHRGEARHPGEARHRDHARHLLQTRHPRRLGVLALGAVAFAMVLVARLVDVQVVDAAGYQRDTTSEVLTKVALPAERGAIYDRNGNILAVSVQRYDVYADDFLIADPSSEAAQLAAVLGTSEATLRRRLHEHSGYVLVARQVTGAMRSSIAALNLPGIYFEDDPLNSVPSGSLFQPVLGGVNAAGAGDAGIEYLYNHLLAGRSGSELLPEAPGGLAMPGRPKDVVAPGGGEGIVLSLDEPLQVEATKDVTAEMLANHAASGVAVIMDVHTAAILALVDLVRSRSGAIVPAPSNLALTAIYEPGSVMKIATFSYALKDRIITPNTTLIVPYSLQIGGYTFEDAWFHPTEPMPASEILAQSSNIGTIKIAAMLGPQRLYEALHAFGFGKLSGLGWPGESPGIIGSPATWYGSALGSVPIGTGVSVTPMQLLDAFNTVADYGVFRSPHLLDAVVRNGRIEKVPLPPGRRVISSATAKVLIPMMEGVVQDGTAVAACIPGYYVAGKTGTSQVPDQSALGYLPGAWNATFVGYVPAQDPQLSGIVWFNHPNPIYGGAVSAPVFAKIMSYALRHYGIAPPPGSSSAEQGLCGPNGAQIAAANGLQLGQ